MAVRGTKINEVKELRWVNFKGENRTGNNRNNQKSFTAVLYPEDAERLRNEGWNVKAYIDKRDPDAEPIDILDIKVKFHINPYSGNLDPRVYSCVGKKRVLLDEKGAEDLDDVRIVGAHLVINPRFTTVNGNDYVTAWLNLGYFDIDPEAPSTDVANNDPFEDMYD